MKTKTKMLIVAAALAALFAAVPVYAATATKTVTPQPSKPGSTFAQRLAQRKAEQKVTLAKADAQRIKDRCVNVQTSMRDLSEKTSVAVSSHLTTYNNIDAKLWVMIGELKLAKKDTFKLEKDRSEYASKVSTFKADANEYKQMLGDMVLIKCQADPSGFKALLLTARYYYAGMRTDSVAIRKQVVEVIKPALDDFSNQLQPQLDNTRQ